MQSVYRFLAEKNVDAAKRAVKAIRDGVKMIALQPEIGRPTALLEPEYREWLVVFGDTGYVVLYRYDAQSVVMLAVRHQREAGY